MSSATGSILLVCLGNICRSPLAEGVLRHVLSERAPWLDVLVDSAGIGAWHVGSPPDPRSAGIALRHGIDISGQRARRVASSDFGRFGLILGMDASNVDELRDRAGTAHDRIHLFMEYALGEARDVPDPYFGGPGGFEDGYRMILEASEALVAKLAARPFSPPSSGQTSSTT
jgi:protein-tyrosine phosphatase